MVSLTLTLLDKRHLHLHMQWKNLESVKITLVLFNKTQLEAVKWKAEVQTSYSYAISDG